LLSLTSADKYATAYSNKFGEYFFTDVPPDAYTVRLSELSVR